MSTPRRVLVVGITGAGKSTAARLVAGRLDVPYRELDTYAFGPGWASAPDFVATVERLIAEPGWVFDSWGYPEVRELLWSRADTVVWLDYSRRVVLPRVLRRSLRRSWSRAPVFGGNRETWRGWLAPDHPVWWAMREHGRRRVAIAALVEAHPALRVVRLTRPAELSQCVRTLAD